MATLGIDVVFAPVVDVLPTDGRDPLGDDRTFGSDPAVVTEYGQAYVDAFVEAGILPTLKHFPGHGSTTGDSHDGVVSAPPLPQLRERDLVPYDTLLESEVAVMVGHMVVPDVTIFGPSSLSSGIITDLLRDEYGFDGLIFTDSLSMGGVTGQGPPEELAFEALRAGADVALFATPARPRRRARPAWCGAWQNGRPRRRPDRHLGGPGPGREGHRSLLAVMGGTSARRTT